jgi:hypothetical protein
MAALSASEILRVWERGRDQRAAERALTILEAAFPDADPGTLEALSLGRRDERLLSVHRAMFGRDLEATVTCPRCAEQLEFTFDTSRVDVAPMPPPDDLTLDWRGDAVRFRLPDTSDWIAAGECRDSIAAHRLLVERCVLGENRGRTNITELSDALLARVSARIEESDPHAELRLELECPRCEMQWSAVLDVALFVWTELAAHARRLLAEVHTLASAYGWCESDILAMSDARRGCYLQMVS